MKTPSLVPLLVLVGSLSAPWWTVRAAESIERAFEAALLAEEGRRDLTGAIRGYESVVAQVDTQRALAATAVFRLGECYRKLGRTNDAVIQYQRLLRDYAGETVLVQLSTENLAALGQPVARDPVTGIPDASVDARAIRLLERRLARLDTLPSNSPELLILIRDWFPDSLLEQLESERSALARRLADLEVQLAPQHPDRVRADATWRRIEAQMAERVEGLIRAQRAHLEILQAAAGDGGTVGVATAGTGPSQEERAEIARLRALFDRSPDRLNTPDANGRLPLVAAAAAGQLAVVRALLEWGARVNAAGPIPGVVLLGEPRETETALHAAAREGHKAIVEVLLDAGADPNARGSGGLTPLALAIRKQYHAVAETLLARGADPGREPDRISLRVAVQNGATNWIERLLRPESGADEMPPDASAAAGLVRVALEANSKESVRTLVRMGVTPSGEDLAFALFPSEVARGMSRPAVAVDPAWFEELLNATPREVLTPELLEPMLGRVVSENNFKSVPELIPILVRAGASPTANVRKNTAEWELRPVLHLAVSHAMHAGRIDPVRMLLDAGADPNGFDMSRQTALGLILEARQPSQRTDPSATHLVALEDLLRAAGAREDVWRRQFIAVGRGERLERRFFRTREDQQAPTLGDLLAMAYRIVEGRFPLDLLGWPALDRIRIHRLNADGSGLTVVPVAPDWFEQEACSWNLALEWGDGIEIPEMLTRPADARWGGLPLTCEDALQRCTQRRVTLQTGSGSHEVLLGMAPVYAGGARFDPDGTVISTRHGGVPRPVVRKFPARGELWSNHLYAAVRHSGHLLASSDLTRVRVERPSTGEAWTLDLEDDPAEGEFWLVDGDRIEVPTKIP
ncbi:MAG: ankyrin repeat domain-containing protein [Verrucomicrobiae bacterium]|nr:ankyrin repeat domain-containing protein [Verrucomicrobiae bacterium]